MNMHSNTSDYPSTSSNTDDEKNVEFFDKAKEIEIFVSSIEDGTATYKDCKKYEDVLFEKGFISVSGGNKHSPYSKGAEGALDKNKSHDLRDIWYARTLSDPYDANSSLMVEFESKYGDRYVATVRAPLAKIMRPEAYSKFQ